MSIPSFTDEQFKKHSFLARLESQAYFLCQRLSSIYYSVDRDQYDDARLIAILDRAHERRQRRYSAFQSYSKSIGLRV